MRIHRYIIQLLDMRSLNLLDGLRPVVGRGLQEGLSAKNWKLAGGSVSVFLR